MVLDGIVGLIVSAVAIGLVGGLVIWIVSKLNLGLEVDGFGSAFVAAIVVAVVSAVIYWLLGLLGITLGGGWLSAIIHLVVAAVILMISGSILPGLRVAGFLGALVAAVAMGVVAWVIDLILGMF